MVCKECESAIKEGVVFCGVCGAKVVESPKTCHNCGEIVNENAKFCRKCGESTKETPMAELVDDGVEEVAVEEIVGDLVVDEEVAVAVEPGKEKKEKPSLKAFKGKINKNIILSVMLVAVLILVVINFGGKAVGATDQKADFIMFEKDYEDIYGKATGKTEYILKSSDISKTVISKDGKKVYSIDDDANLYIQEDGKAADKIASDVDMVAISPTGDTIAFVKDIENYYGTGALYVKSGSQEPEKVSSEGCLSSSVSISSNGKYVAYTEAEDSEDLRTYLYKVGGTTERVGRHITVGVNDKGSILAFNADADLYMIRKGKEADKIMSNSREIIANKDFSKLLILDDSGTLYSYKGKDREKVEGNIDYIARVKGAHSTNVGILQQTNTKELDVMLVKNGSDYVMLDGKESEKISGSLNEPTIISKDFKKVIYVNNTKLYIKEFKNGKLKEGDAIDSSISSLAVSPDGSKIAYIKEGDLYYLGSGQKVGTRVEAKDDVSAVRILDNGTMYYETRDERLFATTGKKAGNKIADDVYQWEVNDKAVYILDYDATLFEAIGIKDTVKISDDVSALYNDSYIRYNTNM